MCETDNFHTIKELAEIYDIHEQTVRKYTVYANGVILKKYGVQGNEFRRCVKKKKGGATLVNRGFADKMLCGFISKQEKRNCDILTKQGITFEFLVESVKESRQMILDLREEVAEVKSRLATAESHEKVNYNPTITTNAFLV